MTVFLEKSPYEGPSSGMTIIVAILTCVLAGLVSNNHTDLSTNSPPPPAQTHAAEMYSSTRPIKETTNKVRLV